MLKDILRNSSVTNDQLEKFKSIGFSCWNDSVDYTDLELDITYQKKTDNGDDRLSFNLHATFNWEDRTFYMVLGTNEGDGWNEYHQVDCDGSDLGTLISSFIKSLEKSNGKDEYIVLTKKYEDTHSGIIKGASKLSKLLYAS
jgi:hypothetical protein